MIPQLGCCEGIALSINFWKMVEFEAIFKVTRWIGRFNPSKSL